MFNDHAVSCSSGAKITYRLVVTEFVCEARFFNAQTEGHRGQCVKHNEQQIEHKQTSSQVCADRNPQVRRSVSEEKTCGFVIFFLKESGQLCFWCQSVTGPFVFVTTNSNKAAHPQPCPQSGDFKRKCAGGASARAIGRTLCSRTTCMYED